MGFPTYQAVFARPYIGAEHTAPTRARGRARALMFLYCLKQESRHVGLVAKVSPLSVPDGISNLTWSLRVRLLVLRTMRRHARTDARARARA